MINWDNVVSAVATNEGLVVQERRADGTLGEYKFGPPQVYPNARKLSPCPPSQTWDPTVGKCRTFRVVDEAGKHVPYMQAIHPCLPGYVWDPATGKCRTYQTFDEAGR